MTVIKTKTKTNELKALIKSELTCGDCSGLRYDDLIPTEVKRDPQTCGQQGRAASAHICKHYRASAFDLAETLQEEESGDAMISIMKMFGHLEEKDLRIMATMLLKEAKTRRFGMKIGAPVFIRFKGRGIRDYANNFFAARILDVTEEYVRVISEDGVTQLTYENTGFSGPSIYSRSAFQPLRKKMRSQGLINDPEKTIKSAWCPEEDVQFKLGNSLDGVKIARLDNVTKSSKRRVKRTNTLCDIVASIELGNNMGSRTDEAGVTRMASDVYVRSSRTSKRTISGSVELSDL